MGETRRDRPFTRSSKTGGLARASLWIAPAARAREAQEDRLLEVPHLPVPVETAGTVSPSAGRPVATCPRPRDRHQPHARRGEQPRREAVPSRPGSSPLPGFVGLGRPSVDNMSPIAVYLRPRPEEVPPPIPSRFALWFRRGLGPRALTVTLSYGFAGRTSGSCRLSVRLSWWRFRDW